MQNTAGRAGNACDDASLDPMWCVDNFDAISWDIYVPTGLKGLRRRGEKNWAVLPTQFLYLKSVATPALELLRLSRSYEMREDFVKRKFCETSLKKLESPLLEMFPCVSFDSELFVFFTANQLLAKVA